MAAVQQPTHSFIADLFSMLPDISTWIPSAPVVSDAENSFESTSFNIATAANSLTQGVFRSVSDLFNVKSLAENIMFDVGIAGLTLVAGPLVAGAVTAFPVAMMGYQLIAGSNAEKQLAILSVGMLLGSMVLSSVIYRGSFTRFVIETVQDGPGVLGHLLGKKSKNNFTIPPKSMASFPPKTPGTLSGGIEKSPIPAHQLIPPAKEDPQTGVMWARDIFAGLIVPLLHKK